MQAVLYSQMAVDNAMEEDYQQQLLHILPRSTKLGAKAAKTALSSSTPTRS